MSYAVSPLGERSGNGAFAPAFVFSSLGSGSQECPASCNPAATRPCPSVWGDGATDSLARDYGGGQSKASTLMKVIVNPRN
ncbi:hypothetical protein B0H19DRAFT_1266826 [Mycena capillaripes]|nr:hypothetical protein B0H19DRAFT_1266826 [Mycena capillaripes]